MKRKHLMFLGISIGILLVMMWGVVQADTPTVTHPAQKQVNLIMASLIDSEAERASGAYFPGAGVFITMDLLRGPNSTKNKSSYEGTRDWLIYLMQTFGSKLSAVPPSETIGMSVQFYDYAQVFYHQLVIICQAAAIADPSKYSIWLDGTPYTGALGQTAVTTSTPISSSPVATTGLASPVSTSSGNKTVTPTVVTATQRQAAPVQVGERLTALEGTFKLIPDVNSLQSSKDWNVVNGQWEFTDQGYKQAELGKFDLISYYNRPILGNFRLQSDMKVIEGDMGGGLVFNASSNNTKNGAQMISFTGKGTFLQWGYYDGSGIFQYQGGTAIANIADGQKHTLEIRLTDNTYDVILDGKILGQKLSVYGTVGGYAGLMASTSQVLFNNIILENL